MSALGEGSDDMHPDHDVAVGEAFLKRVYEAVRGSPQWNNTLLLITFDEVSKDIPFCFLFIYPLLFLLHHLAWRLL